MTNWTREQKQAAIVLAESAGSVEAARATGIPAGTIRSWLCRAKDPAQRTAATQRSGKKLEQLQQAAVEKAVEQAGDYITERLKGLADRLYSLAEKATAKVDKAIDPIPDGGEMHDRDGAAWLRSLVGVLSQSIDKAQLLSGKPTARPEVTNRHEYDITQRIVTEQPELIDRIFAADEPGLADRRR